MEEDFVLGEIAKKRKRATTKWLSHDEAWKTKPSKLMKRDTPTLPHVIRVKH